MNRELIRQQMSGNMPLAIRTSDGGQSRVPHPNFGLVGRHPFVLERDKGIDPLHWVSVRPGHGRRKGQNLGE